MAVNPDIGSFLNPAGVHGTGDVAVFIVEYSGNTFDAFLSWLRGHPLEGSNAMTEIVISMIGFPIVLPIINNVRNNHSPDFANQYVSILGSVNG